LIQIQTSANTPNDVKAALKLFKFCSAKEVTVADDKKAIVIVVPYMLLTSEFKRAQAKLVRDLEKKYSGCDVVFIARRTILPKHKKDSKAKNVKRPRCASFSFSFS
jgi:small subunit ribosomal protein S7e